MIGKIYTCAVTGINGIIIEVEIDISNGLPGFTIVGLPDTAIKESRERVRTSIKNSGYDYPLKRVTVNLAPADIKKEGPCYDLPIAIGLLYASGQIDCIEIGEYLFLGELSLDGRVKPVNGVLCMAADAVKKGFKKAIVPFKNASEAAIIRDIEVYPVSTLKETVEMLEGISSVEPYNISEDKIMGPSEGYEDFSDIKGQENAKRALEIAAAGGHNVIML